MPQNRLWWQYGVVLIAYGIGTEFILTYEWIETVTGLSEGEWVAGVFGSFMVISGALYWQARRAGSGAVTANGLEWENGQTIALADIKKIVREGEGFPAVVFTAEDKEIMHLRDIEFIKLAETGLSKWRIDDYKLTVEPGESGQELQINYASVGMYTHFFEQVKWVFIFSISAKAFSGTFWVAKFLYGASLYVVSLCLLIVLPMYFWRVKVAVTGDKVVVKRGKKEEGFRISDVTSLERGIFQVKVTTKRGEVFRFPRACILLPELIEEYGNIKDNGRNQKKIEKNFRSGL